MVNLVYKLTVHGNPFRKLLRDSYLQAHCGLHYLVPYLMDFCSDFYRDVFVEFTRLLHFASPSTVSNTFFVTIWEKDSFDKCHYHHHHGTSLPRCVPPPPHPFEMENHETDA